MNLVDTIKNELFSNGHLHELSSLIGAGEGATRTAIGAAVPAVLSAITNVASSGGGAQKVISALGRLDPETVSHPGHMLSGQADTVLEQGSGLLNSLLGGNTISGIVNALSRFSGIGGAAVQKLLGYLMPMILGGIAGRFTGRAASAQALTNLLADQKSAIANALPSGLSLKDVPGLASVESAARGAVDATTTAGSSLMKWALPLAALVAIAWVAWWFLGRGESPVLNEATGGIDRLSTNLTGHFKSLTDTLTGINDAASAQLALPKLTELGAKLDGMKALVDKLPAAEKAKITDLIKPGLAKLEDQFAKLQWMPGVGDKIQPAVDGVMNKLASLGDLPAPQLPRLSGDLAGVVSSLTESLSGIKDAASAEAVLPKLTEVSGKLDDTKASMDKLSAEGKTTMNSMLKSALAKLKELVDKVLALPGVGEKLKPVLDGITSKLNDLAG
jgi:hypothetical protein